MADIVIHIALHCADKIFWAVTGYFIGRILKKRFG